MLTSSLKKKELDKISQEIENCRICKKGKIGKAVPGEGNPSAKVMFIGEAPGKEEAKTGRPFVGRSGKLLRLKISEIDLDEKNVFITSPVKYLPVKGTPTDKEIKHGRVHLLKQIEIIQPKIIILLGKVAARGMLNEDIPVVKEHGKIIKKDDIIFFITVHPAAAIRFTKMREILKKDFEKLKLILQGKVLVGNRHSELARLAAKGVSESREILK